MAKLKITFRKEVWADLNAYYPSFSPGLRKSIDNAIYKLLGGQEIPEPKGNNKSKYIPIAGTVIIKRTTKECSRPASKTAALVNNYKMGNEYLMEDVKKVAVSRHGMQKDSCIQNLVRDGYFELVK